MEDFTKCSRSLFQACWQAFDDVDAVARAPERFR
jgi:hypothetical protein